MDAEIICIGSELLLGQTIDTNAAYISQKLAGIGINVFYHTTVGDNRVRLLTTFKRAVHRADIVITTGGLGPTVDDITLETITQALQKKLLLNGHVLRNIKAHFQSRHIPMPRSNLRQALIPEGAQTLKNSVGTAPGLIITHEKKILISLPGVPAEVKPMIEDDVLGYLKTRFPSNWLILSHKVKTTGLAESQVNQKVKDILQLKPPLTVGIYAHTQSVDLHVNAKAHTKQKAEKLIKPVINKIKSRLKEYIYAYDDDTMEEVVARALTKRKKSVSVAESCTGGLIGKRLTATSGSSKRFPLSIVAYSNTIKSCLLNIPAEILKKYGAVSKETSTLMANNIKQIANTDLGLAVTGIAGPTGATQEKPIGTVYIALSSARKTRCQKFHFHGDREAVRLRASQAALDMLRRYLT